MCPFRLKVLAGALVLVSAAVMLFAEQGSGAGKRVVVLTRLTSPAGDPVAESLAATITSSIDVVMRLTGNITVERADFLAPTAFFDRALGYYQQVNADGAVYGSVVPGNNGSYAIDLYIWNSARANEKPAAIHRSIANVLLLFQLADVLSLRVASTVVGRTLTEGTLVVKNVGGLKNYAVYADGHLLGRNRSSFHVLTGEREIAVAKPGILGDVPIKVFHVQIEKDHTTTVSLPVAAPKPPPSPAAPPVVKEAAPAKRAPAPPLPGRLRVTVSPRAPAEAHFTVTGTGGTTKFDLSEYVSKWLELSPGSYRLTASLGADTGIGYRHTIDIAAGKTFALDVPLDYTTPFKISRLKIRRSAFATALAHSEKERRVRGWRAFALTVGGLASGALSGVSYFIGKGSYASYQSATSATTATQYRTEVLTYSGLTIGGGVAAAGLLLWDIADLHARPSARHILALRRSISELDKQIRTLATDEGGGT